MSSTRIKTPLRSAIRSAGLFLVAVPCVARGEGRRQGAFHGASPQAFGALGGGGRCAMGFLDENRLAAADREAILHVPPNEVAFNALFVRARGGSHSPEKHQVCARHLSAWPKTASANGLP